MDIENILNSHWDNEKEEYKIQTPWEMDELLEDRREFLELDHSLFGWFFSLSSDMYNDLYATACEAALNEEPLNSHRFMTEWAILELCQGKLEEGFSFTGKEFDETVDTILGRLAIFELYKRVGNDYRIADDDEDWEWQFNTTELTEAAADVPLFIKMNHSR